MRYDYIAVERGLSQLMDGGNPQSFSNVLWRPPTANMGVNTTILHRLALKQGRLQNRSGGTILCGFGARLSTQRWHAGQAQRVGAGYTYTDDTDDAQDTGANDFALEVAGTAGSGFLVSALDRFNVICLDIGTASAGGSAVRRLMYSQAGGTWAAITNALVAPVTAGDWAAQETLVWFAAPPDWAVLEAGHGTNVRVGEYGIAVESTTAPTATAGVADSMSVAQVVGALEGLTDNTEYVHRSDGSEHAFDCLADSLVAVVSSVAAVQSIATALVRCRG